MASGNNESDNQILIKRIAGQDEAAFDELVGRYQRQVLNLIYRFTRSIQDSEEIAQDVFVKVWQRAASFKGKSKIFTWVYRIAVNLAINHLKKKKIAVQSLDAAVSTKDGYVLPQVPLSGHTQPDSLFAEKEFKSFVNNVVDKLPGKQKMALVLSKYENRPYAEIAEIMQVSIPTVKSLLFRAKQNLKKYLQQAGNQ